MSNLKNKIRIICTKKDEEEIMELIQKFNFHVKNRYDRGIIILELSLPYNYNPDKLQRLLELQDNLLGLS